METTTTGAVHRHGLATFAVVVALFGSERASAQDETDAAASAIDEIVVVATEDRLSLMPAGPLNGAFGLPKGLLDTPRSVTEVRAELVKRYALRSVDDLVRLTPGAFTSSFFGIRGAMDIRGEPADNYFRGFRRITNLGNFNTVVGGANTLEIMRGPVSPFYGACMVRPAIARVETS